MVCMRHLENFSGMSQAWAFVYLMLQFTFDQAEMIETGEVHVPCWKDFYIELVFALFPHGRGSHTSGVHKYVKGKVHTHKAPLA